MFNNYYVGEFLMKQKNVEVERISHTAWMRATPPSTSYIKKQQKKVTVQPNCCPAA